MHNEIRQGPQNYTYNRSSLW